MINFTDRRKFLLYSASTALLTATAPDRSRAAELSRRLSWHNPAQWGIEGRGFDDTARYYDRLPARAEKSVRQAVWKLSQHSAGMSVRFKTDSPLIRVKYRLTSNQLAMPHMPATGVSGVDLYAKNDNGEWRWVAVLKPGNVQVDADIATNLATSTNGLREFMLFLPLYNGLEDLEIGVADNTTFESIAPRAEKPILFYGTSIMQGACASRSGMAIPAIIGRRLNRPTINFGFSGNGKMELEVGKFLCELDPCVFVVDCLPNMNAKLVAQRCAPLVHQIRESHPETPILIVEDRVNTGAWIRRNGTAHHSANHDALKEAYEQLRQKGGQKLHYLSATSLLGNDGDAATDGSHPSDLGMLRYAKAYEIALNKFL